MKIILLFMMIIVSANAYECSIKGNNGSIYTTMYETYKEDGNIKSMWFKYKKIVNKKEIETGKDHIQVKDEKFRVLQEIIYDAKGNTKSHYQDGEYSKFDNSIPETIGQWKVNIVTNGAYLYDIPDSKKDEQVVCSALGMGFLVVDMNGTIIPPKNFYGASEGTKYAKDNGMTLEETKKWLEENTPKK